MDNFERFLIILAILGAMLINLISDIEFNTYKKATDLKIKNLQMQIQAQSLIQTKDKN